MSYIESIDYNGYSTESAALMDDEDKAVDEQREFMDWQRVDFSVDERARMFEDARKRKDYYGSAQWQRKLTSMYRRERIKRAMRDNWQDVLYYGVMMLVAAGLVTVILNR